MTIPVSIQNVIRREYEAGKSLRAIATDYGLSRNTVTKYVDRQDFSIKPRPTSSRSRVDPYSEVILHWLKQDETAPRKQRHTGVRIWQRLIDEHGFEGSVDAVQRWLRKYRENQAKPGEGYTELAWQPATMQVDFGEAQAVIAGNTVAIHILAVTFPFSNARYCIALPGQSVECFCWGLRQIMEHVGFVPRVMVFDNAPALVRITPGNKRHLTELFSSFLTHYRIEAKFTNPASGNEKGSVENAVGYLRRNMLVPIPAAETLEGLSKQLLKKCDHLLDLRHYRKDERIGDLFKIDQLESKPLPGIGFDACIWMTRLVDKVGNIQVKGTRYYVGSHLQGQNVQVGLRANSIEVCDLQMRRIIETKRVWAKSSETVLDPVMLLESLTLKPVSFSQSPIRKFIPATLNTYIDKQSLPDKRELLLLVKELSYDYGFKETITAAAEVVTSGRKLDEPSLNITLRRARQPKAERPQPVIDFTVYDRLARQNGANNA